MVSLNNVSFAYGSKKLFNNVSLTINEGKIYGLIGKNGSGKTSLLKIISGLLFPHSGEAIVLNHKSSDRRPEVASQIFFIPESFFLPNTTGKMYATLNAPFYPAFSFDKFNEFSIDNTKLLHTLSFGQKKKFMLAFGFATGAKILIFDEPTNGLDIPSQKMIRKILADFINENRSVIISTHHFRELENIFDEILVLDEGSILIQSDINKLTSGIAVKLLPSLEESPEYVIYSEKIPGGYSALVVDENAQADHGVLEYLLNAVLLGDTNTINYINSKNGGNK
ncbi:MAG: hypothetical protein A2015_15495 [Spirochaetes bacterium GWF1_31_7]|nr:MAG: hypothetical protein A2Y30_11915 [Spirochaetes bacterium GWE1_32_154]OHD47270.1 MAG: hypothetical protein A2Y29_02930 [Spirochaetes bacterium GWE2_31_10]OHD52142.1 MAG: hypothetical protein A2015_15495 [Spirochaetes bacterium GWF1_31_7]OHD81255.1 MAG: hypothetical protein A2355_03520 [Spirochaetes bacterium RIFOXYB1_FULL_32_8]HBD96326.1 hypothetical protein [Spirochaetia bacterium]